MCFSRFAKVFVLCFVIFLFCALANQIAAHDEQIDVEKFPSEVKVKELDLEKLAKDLEKSKSNLDAMFGVLEKTIELEKFHNNERSKCREDEESKMKELIEEHKARKLDRRKVLEAEIQRKINEHDEQFYKEFK